MTHKPIPIITVPDTAGCFCGAAEDPDGATVCTCAEQVAAAREEAWYAAEEEAAAREEARYAAEEEAGCHYPGPFEWER